MNCLAASWIESKELILISISIGLIEFLLFAKVHAFPHFDFYRIKKLDEVYDMGYEDYFYSGALCFIEWPELVEELLPGNAVKVEIEESEDGSRIMHFEAE